MPDLSSRRPPGRGQSGGGNEDTAAPPAPPPAPQASTSKVGRIRAILASPSGASLPKLCEATGWQSHSVRAAITGLRKGGARIEKAKDESGTALLHKSCEGFIL